MTKPEPWCVKHRDGWCLVKTGMRPAEAATSVPTKCGQFVILPSGIEQRQPDCDECRASAGAIMTTLDDLIARLSEATGADRELDVEIAKELGWTYVGEDWFSPSGQRFLAPPIYTFLAESALSILGYGKFSVEINGNGASVDGHEATAATPALALTIAALKARKARP